MGYKWKNGKSYSEPTEWDIYDNRTCYNLYNGSYERTVYYFTIIPSTEIETFPESTEIEEDHKSDEWQAVDTTPDEFRVALGMCGIYTSQNKAYTALLAAEKYLEKGGDFSLMDATLIESEVEKRNLKQ